MPGRATVVAYEEEGGLVLDTGGDPLTEAGRATLREIAAAEPEGGGPQEYLAGAGVGMVMRAIPRERYTRGAPIVQASNTVLSAAEIETTYATAPSVTDMLQRRFPALVREGDRLFVVENRDSPTCRDPATGGPQEPHYIVNGVAVSPSWALGLNPRDVIGVNLLRFGAEIAMYGFRGTCGVLEITTR
jgi:hypothetical protein